MTNKTKVSKKDNKIIKELVQATIKHIKKTTGREVFTVDEMEEKFGVPDYISTGLPHWDLTLFHNKDRTAYGIPYGRVTEIHGENSSFKSTMLLTCGAKNIAKNGITYSAVCEMDYDSSYVKKFLMEEGLDPNEVKDNWVIQPVKTVKEFFQFVKGIIDPLKALADELEAQGKDPLKELPRIVITLDSLAALTGEVNHERIEEDWDKGDQMGSFAGEIHRFFKFFLYDIGRLGIALILSNHFRDNLGFGMKKNIPAHDSAIKFYASLRMETKLGYDKGLTSKASRDKMDHKVAVPLNIKIYKARRSNVMSGELSVAYYYNHGFDYIGSLIEAGRMTSLISEKGKVLGLNLPEDDPDFKKYDDKSFGVKELRETLKSDLDLMYRLEKLAYKMGPRVIEDTR